MQTSSAAVWASWQKVCVWIGMPVMLNFARLAVLGCAGLAAVAGFTLVATVLAFLPFVFLGGLSLLITVVLIVSVSGFVSISATLFYLSRSQQRQQQATRSSKERSGFLAHPTDFKGSPFQVLHSCATH